MTGLGVAASKVALHVNIDHVATLRQARGTSYPDPIWAASLCELAGAQGITVHLREDRRHIQDRDVRLLRQTVRGVLNLEMAATAEMVGIAQDIRPDIVTLVPEKREERTTEGGLRLEGNRAVAEASRALDQAKIPVSLFIDPEVETVRAAEQMGVGRIELATGDYCNATAPEAIERELGRVERAASAANDSRLHVAAGHGLDYPNVGPIASIAQVTELNIGHAIVSRAVLVGLEQAVRDMISAIDGAMRSRTA